jgi:NitT/TauT family transport system substrate-binding protein
MPIVKKYSISLIILLVLVGCTPNAPIASTAVPPRAVKIQLDWVHTVEYAGFYLAEANGDFARENLSVELFPSDGSIDPIEALNKGDVDFAIAGADTVLLAREAGQDVVAIATIYQRLPLGFMSLADSHILTPKDLIGKKVMMTMVAGTSQYAFQAMMKVTGVDISGVNLIPRGDIYDEEPLRKGEVDVMDVYVTNQVVQMKRAGVAVNVIVPVDYGVEMYINTIVTTRSMIETKPELVQAFVRAFTTGLQAAVADPQAAAQASVKKNAELVYESELASMNTSLPFLIPSQSKPGMMSATTWDYIYKMLLEQNILKPGQYVEDAYDLSFLEAVYPK